MELGGDKGVSPLFFFAMAILNSVSKHFSFLWNVVTH